MVKTLCISTVAAVRGIGPRDASIPSSRSQLKSDLLTSVTVHHSDYAQAVHEGMIQNLGELGLIGDFHTLTLCPLINPSFQFTIVNKFGHIFA